MHLGGASLFGRDEARADPDTCCTVRQRGGQATAVSNTTRSDGEHGPARKRARVLLAVAV